MGSIFRIQFIFLILFSINSFAENYTLKKGDTLANVARKFYGEPVWGPKGTIQRIYKLNPWALTTPNLVEPGQTLVIDDATSSEKKTEHAATSPAVLVEKQLSEVAKEAVVLPPIEPMKKAEPIAQQAAQQTLTKEEAALPEQPVLAETKPAPAPTPSPAPVAVAQQEKIVVKAMEEATASGVKRKPKSYFIVAPTISIGKISTSTDPSASSYDLSSDSSYGLRLGWDHWWTTLFSTVFNYNLKQLKSNATNDTTADTYASTVTTNSYDFALLNKMGRLGRFGLGATYGNHLFVEGFSASPANQSVYSIYFWNPFLLGDFSLLSTDLLDMNFALKLAALPSDVGHDHDLKSGFEYSARLSIIEKLGDSAFSFGINYSQNTQARIGTNATLTQTTVDLGFMF